MGASQSYLVCSIFSIRRSKNKAERRSEVDLTRVGDLQGQDNERKKGQGN